MATAVFGPKLVLPIIWSRKLVEILVVMTMVSGSINPIGTVIITLVNLFGYMWPFRMATGITSKTGIAYA